MPTAEHATHFFHIRGSNLSGDDLNHSLADSFDLLSLSVGRLLHLIGPPLGETNTEESEKVAIGSLNVTVGLNQCLPFLYHRSKFVSGHSHTCKRQLQITYLANHNTVQVSGLVKPSYTCNQ